ncbi:hypothetical protein FORMB_02130 [Formosa sp. Hel1_33_131]|nr:hypothetical protein FORMB_02130 [Formosa sp. Hel1_33_131]
MINIVVCVVIKTVGKQTKHKRGVDAMLIFGVPQKFNI